MLGGTSKDLRALCKQKAPCTHIPVHLLNKHQLFISNMTLLHFILLTGSLLSVAQECWREQPVPNKATSKGTESARAFACKVKAHVFVTINKILFVKARENTKLPLVSSPDRFSVTG